MHQDIYNKLYENYKLYIFQQNYETDQGVLMYILVIYDLFIYGFLSEKLFSYVNLMSMYWKLYIHMQYFQTISAHCMSMVRAIYFIIMRDMFVSF